MDSPRDPGGDPSPGTSQNETSTGDPPAAGASGSRQPASTPFDHPLFLPGLLAALAVWFAYDGWLNSDPEMQKHLAFNRWGAGILVILASWFGYRGFSELKQTRKNDASEPKPYRPID